MYELELEALTHGELHRFADWPDMDVPLVAAGVYSIWNRRGEFIYVGMSGRFTEEVMTAKRLGNKPAGLRTRLGSHASGRRSGDQFCVYVCDRLVLPTLDTERIQAVGRGELSLDRLTRDYIHAELSYRYVVVDPSAAALAIEQISAAEGLAGNRPFLNPRSPTQPTMYPGPTPA